MTPKELLSVVAVFVMMIGIVRPLAPELIPFMSSLNVEQNEPYQLICGLSKGSKPIQFQWFKDGFKLESSSSILIDSNPSFSNLKIVSLQHEHSGNYTCSAESPEGTDRTWTFLQVKGL